MAITIIIMIITNIMAITAARLKIAKQSGSILVTHNAVTHTWDATRDCKNNKHVKFKLILFDLISYVI